MLAFANYRAGFAALRMAEERVRRVNSASFEPKPPAVALDVGQIFRHRKHGFRGVVVEWFETCPGDDEWFETYGPFERGREQPFYRTLVDTKDRPHPFVALAAEENLEPLDGEALPVDHPLMDQCFSDFDGGRHTLSDDWAQKYPDN